MGHRLEISVPFCWIGPLFQTISILSLHCLSHVIDSNGGNRRKVSSNDNEIRVLFREEENRVHAKFLWSIVSQKFSREKKTIFQRNPMKRIVLIRKMNYGIQKLWIEKFGRSRSKCFHFSKPLVGFSRSMNQEAMRSQVQFPSKRE